MGSGEAPGLLGAVTIGGRREYRTRTMTTEGAANGLHSCPVRISADGVPLRHRLEPVQVRPRHAELALRDGEQEEYVVILSLRIADVLGIKDGDRYMGGRVVVSKWVGEVFSDGQVMDLPILP